MSRLTKYFENFIIFMMIFTAALGILLVLMLTTLVFEWWGII